MIQKSRTIISVMNIVITILNAVYMDKTETKFATELLSIVDVGIIILCLDKNEMKIARNILSIMDFVMIVFNSIGIDKQLVDVIANCLFLTGCVVNAKKIVSMSRTCRNKLYLS